MAKSKILIVDDEAQLVNLLKLRLQAHGYEVFSAKDGEEALETIKGKMPDLVVLDLLVPHLNGYEVCAILKRDSRFQKIPLIICTAKTQEKEIKEAMDCGADAYVQKPFESQELLSKVQVLLETKPVK